MSYDTQAGNNGLAKTKAHVLFPFVTVAFFMSIFKHVVWKPYPSSNYDTKVLNLVSLGNTMYHI